MIGTVSLLAFLCLVPLTACEIVMPSRPIAPESLTGDWRSDYHGLGFLGQPLVGTEVITFREDGTYQQAYTDGRGYNYLSEWNRWRLESLPNGPQQVHLEKARYYPSGVDFAEDLEIGRVSHPGTRRQIGISFCAEK